MVEIKDDRVRFDDGKYIATCSCGKVRQFTEKSSAIRMLNKGSCVNCARDYVQHSNEIEGVFKKDGKWCKICSGCGIEQAYTRKDHAVQSLLTDWQCRSCAMSAKKFSENRPVGDKTRLYNRFRKSAYSRGLEWSISIEEMFENFTGYCSLTGWEISLSYIDTTASLDRIDNNKGYVKGNTQWVHTMVNMMRNKYPLETFVNMCIAVSNNYKDNTAR